MASPSTSLLPPQPPDTDASLAKESVRVLAPRIQTAPLRLRLIDDATAQTIQLPASAARLLVRILDNMAQGNATALIPVSSELTTNEAADFLDISRPTLVQLLDQGLIEYRRVGTHRRVRLDSLTAYKRKADADRKAALAELAAYDEELGL